MGPPVPRSAANPWASGLENYIPSSTARVEPTAARVWPKLVSCKSLSECCEARAGAEPGLVVNWYLGLENGRRSSPARAEPTAVIVCPNSFPAKALASAAKAPNEKKYVKSFLD